jgi:hypothetical protein
VRPGPLSQEHALAQVTQHGPTEPAQRLQEYRQKLAGIYVSLGRRREAAEQLQAALEAADGNKARLQALCGLADLQVES